VSGHGSRSAERANDESQQTASQGAVSGSKSEGFFLWRNEMKLGMGLSDDFDWKIRLSTVFYIAIYFQEG